MIIALNFVPKIHQNTDNFLLFKAGKNWLLIWKKKKNLYILIW